jgi:hypothetical protein
MRMRLLVGLLIVWTVAGCGKSPPAAVAVKGRVSRADGKPVTNMLVTFTPRDEQNRATRPTALLDSNGRYEVKCVPGKYKVNLAPIPVQAGGGSPAGSGDGSVGKVPTRGDLKPIPPKYRDAETSPWEVIVTPGQTEEAPELKVN